MINKSEIKLIKAFLIESGMTQTDFARGAGIGIRTLYNALHGGKISDKIYYKIIDFILEESAQMEVIGMKPRKSCKKFLNILYFSIPFWVAALLLLGINCLFN